MKTFVYRALDETGRTATGVVAAHDAAAASGLLLRRRLHLVALDDGGVSGDHIDAGRSRALPQDIRLRTLRATVEFMQAGLAFEVALRLTERNETDATTRRALGETRRMVGEGETPARALALAGLTTPLQEVVLSAGERAGQLQLALARLVEECAYEEQVRRRLMKALMYPAVLMCTGCATVAVLLLVVVPRFALLAEAMGQPLPATLAGLMAVRAMFTLRGGVALAAATAVVLGAAWRRRLSLADSTRALLRRLPLLRGVLHTWESAACLRALGALLSGGVALLHAMQHVRASTTNIGTRAALSRTIECLVAGEPLVRTLVREGVVPSVVAPVLEIGEGTGTLHAAFTKSAVMLQQRGEEQVDAMLTLVQPLMVLALGAAIAILAGSLLQSVYALRPVAI